MPVERQLSLSSFVPPCGFGSFERIFNAFRRTSTGNALLLVRSHVACVSKLRKIKKKLKRHQRAVGSLGAVCVVLRRLAWEPVSPFAWRMRNGTCLYFLRLEAPSTVL